MERKLILEPGQIKVKVCLWHRFVSPAGQFGKNTCYHVHDEAILAIQQVQERTPGALLSTICMVVKDFNTTTILLHKIKVKKIKIPR